MAPTSTTARPMPLRRSVGALALGVGLLLAGLQPAHAETPASPPPDGGFSELPRSAQDQALQEEGLTREDVARGQALQKLSATTGGALRVAGLAAIYGKVFQVWLDDDTPSALTD